MPDEGNLDPGCSRLHHDGYETSGASSRTSSRPTLNQRERPGRSWGGMRNMNAVRDNPSAGKKDVHQDLMGPREDGNCRYSPKVGVYGHLQWLQSALLHLTISFEGPVLDFCDFTNIMHSSNSFDRICNVFYNDGWHFRTKWILTQVWWKTPRTTPLCHLQRALLTS